jgi:hypothetical protein
MAHSSSSRASFAWWVVGAGVVLVHGLLDETHAERARVEIVVAPGVGGDRGEMMDAGELHDRGPF